MPIIINRQSENNTLMKDIYHKYGPFIVMLIVAFFCYLIVRPFILSIISAALLACIFYPLYSILIKKTKKPNLSAFLVLLAVFVIIIVPSIAISASLVSEIPKVYSSFLKFTQDANYFTEFLAELSEASGSEIHLKSIISSVVNYMLKYLQGFLSSLPSKTLNITVSALFLFFFLREGEQMLHVISQHMPFGKKRTLAIISDVSNLINAMVLGQLVTAGVQGILATVAFTLLGIEGALFWGILLFILSVIPLIGPAFVYVPLGAGLILSHVFEGTGTLFKGIILLAFGFGILSSIDNIIKPMILSDKVKMHPALSLIAIIGGIGAFGFVGILLGPIFVTILMALFRYYDLDA